MLSFRTVRSVSSQDDEVISSEDISTFLLQFSSTLQACSTKNKYDGISSTNDIPEKVYKNKNLPAHIYEMNLQLMKEFCGFAIKRVSSVLDGGGLGVRVTTGKVPPNKIVAMYPGKVFCSV